MKGDKYCIICRDWIGNYLTGETPTGPASYFSIIRRKYCKDCGPWKRGADDAFNHREFRSRKRQISDAKDQRLAELADEILRLRELVKELRK